ncbi:MAG: cell division protein [Alteromonadaceae bacterium]|nr:MAG: cell division protein [Alteromonadaceae bacterium]
MASKKVKNMQILPLWRLIVVAGVIAFVPVALLWHLAHLQVLPGQERGFRFLQTEGEARTLRKEAINAYRGAITDRNGELLAVSTQVKSIYANPQQLKVSQYPALAKALGWSQSALNTRLLKYKQKQFVYLKRHLPPYEADEILAHRFTGVSGEEEYRRYYPAGEVVAHVLGFTDIDDIGREGVELAYEQWLAGAPGAKKLVKDLKGNVVKDLGMLAAPKPGNDLQLTIDLRLQYIAHKELKSAIKKQGAKSGSLVIVAVETGELLAIVNQPSYNPNNRSNVKAYQLRNRAFTDVFEPGSTVKPFAVMAALESGKYTAEHQIDTNPGHWRVGSKTIIDPVNYGVIDLNKIIIKSSQVGISKLAIEMGPELLHDMYYRVGLGQSSGSGFPGESDGYLPNRASWHPIEVATLAYGYGLTVNAVQLAQAYSVIASGGKFIPVKLLSDSNNEPAREVVDSRVASKVAGMLARVVTSGGTGTRAHVDAYHVAGKTGTTHKVGKNGYVDDKYVALFAGFAPVEKPEVVMVVVINEPPSDGEYSGGKAAAPVFSKTMEKVLRVLRVPPEVLSVTSVAGGHHG